MADERDDAKFVAAWASWAVSTVCFTIAALTGFLGFGIARATEHEPTYPDVRVVCVHGEMVWQSTSGDIAIWYEGVKPDEERCQ